MDIVSQSADGRKYGWVDNTIKITPHAVRAYRAQVCVLPKEHGKRGKITGFSPAARRRMRDAIARAYMLGATNCGLTLTLPWDSRKISQADAVALFPALWDDFCKNRFGRLFRRSAMIYRIELQTRGMPHVHALCYFAQEDMQHLRTTCPGLSDRNALHKLITQSWAKSICLGDKGRDDKPPTDNNNSPCTECKAGKATGRPSSHLNKGLWSRKALKGFWRHGVSVDGISGQGRMASYLCDHATKSKQAQLGYTGKQWGIIGRRNLTMLEWRKVQLPDAIAGRVVALMRRYLSRAVRPLDFAGHRTKVRHENWLKFGRGIGDTPPPKWEALWQYRRRSRRAPATVWLSEASALRLLDLALENAKGVQMTMYRTKLYGLTHPETALEVRQHDTESAAREYANEIIGLGYTVDIEHKDGARWVIVASLHY